MSEGGHLGEHDFRSPLAEMPRVLLDWNGRSRGTAWQRVLQSRCPALYGAFQLSSSLAGGRDVPPQAPAVSTSA
jgi:hypothetical protein